MECPKCKTENSDKVTFCVRCHTPLRYTCPSCKHVQLQGGKCEKCGVDFAKYAAMLVFRAKDTAQSERAKSQRPLRHLQADRSPPHYRGALSYKVFCGKGAGRVASFAAGL